ncbi:MAG TPA: LysR family transcriptional regulator [Bryobacteraceae bacterium]|nr:LysR family transcriptional regulator [Bryobacteraceae bacterium]
MELRQFELFLAVMDHSSVTHAAQKMFITPGAVSLQLHNLAAELRTELFTRAGKRLVPTSNAHRLAEHARRILNEVRQIEQEFENDPARDTRPFRFATGATTLIHRLGRPLRLLKKQYPRTEIQVTVYPTEEIVAGLLSRQFDLGLISLPLSNDALKILPLYEEELLVLRPSHTRVRGNRIGTVNLNELASASFVLYPKRSNMRSIIDQFFDKAGIAPRVVMEADDTEAIKSLVASGFAYSILPSFALRGSNRFFHVMRVSGHTLVRRQALATARTEYPRALTEVIALSLQNALMTAPG